MATKGKPKKSKISDEAAALEERKRRSRFVLAILGVALIVVLTFMLSRPKPEAKVNPTDNDVTESPVDINLPGHIKFNKEGELTFTTSGGIEISKLDIEIAQTPLETTQGLMYRSEMGPDQGMLFIFPYERPQSFWMKNTQIPLDMIFVNSNMTIVTIRKDTVPFDESSYASTEPAKFVVEVNAGYTNQYRIKVGDKIKWTETL